MHRPEAAPPTDKEQWVIWNGSLGVVAMATLGRVEVGASGRRACLDPPFEMVGPFSLDELETCGRIVFEACVVMSRQRWQEDQVELRREAHEKRRQEQERWENPRHAFDERELRETLNLPIGTALEPAQIKAAYRRLAQKAHPDAGGDHDLFCSITEARNVLLDQAALRAG